LLFILLSQISEAVLKGHIKVLYVSPERLCTPAFRRLITLLKQQQQFHTQQGRSEQPVVSLLCVDEAHCLSQWSYNFRPAFLRIRREIQFIQPAAVLALTATATPRIQVPSHANRAVLVV
jgi:superfamily II DNA helicase RecQ